MFTRGFRESDLPAFQPRTFHITELREVPSLEVTGMGRYNQTLQLA